MTWLLADTSGHRHGLIRRGLPWTLFLLSIATILAFIFGNTIGAMLGWRRTPKAMKAVLPFTLTFTSIPFFMLAILLIYVFAFGLKWFPVSGGYGRGVTMGLKWEFIKSALYHAILPAMAIVITTMGGWALGVRGMMISVDSEDFLILAQAKALKPRGSFALRVRNALLDEFTALALTLGSSSAARPCEYLFAHPGNGLPVLPGHCKPDYT